MTTAIVEEAAATSQQPQPYVRPKAIWTAEEDEKLKDLIDTHGVQSWTRIAQDLPGRTGKQCRERWHNHLGSGIKKGEWSEEEDRTIVAMQMAIGNQWSKISKLLAGRTDNAVKNRFHVAERARNSGRSKLGQNSHFQAMVAKLEGSFLAADLFVAVRRMDDPEFHELLDKYVQNYIGAHGEEALPAYARPGAVFTGRPESDTVSSSVSSNISSYPGAKPPRDGEEEDSGGTELGADLITYGISSDEDLLKINTDDDAFKVDVSLSELKDTLKTDQDDDNDAASTGSGPLGDDFFEVVEQRFCTEQPMPPLAPMLAAAQQQPQQMYMGLQQPPSYVFPPRAGYADAPLSPHSHHSPTISPFVPSGGPVYTTNYDNGAEMKYDEQMMRQHLEQQQFLMAAQANLLGRPQQLGAGTGIVAQGADQQYYITAKRSQSGLSTTSTVDNNLDVAVRMQQLVITEEEREDYLSQNEMQRHSLDGDDEGGDTDTDDERAFYQGSGLVDMSGFNYDDTKYVQYNEGSSRNSAAHPQVVRSPRRSQASRDSAGGKKRFWGMSWLLGENKPKKAKKDRSGGGMSCGLDSAGCGLGSFGRSRPKAEKDERARPRPAPVSAAGQAAPLN